MTATSVPASPFRREPGASSMVGASWNLESEGSAMRAMVAAALISAALVTTPSFSQDVSGPQGVTAAGDTAGSQGGSGRKGRHKTEQKTSVQAPKADEKDYRSALDRLSNQKFDPWHDVR